MKLLYLDIIGGIAGDMTVAALLELGVPLETLRDGLKALGVEGIGIDTEPAERHSIAGTRFVVTDTSGAGHSHGHSHGDSHAHGASGQGHPHRPYREIQALLERAALPGKSGEMAQAVFARLAAAEGKVHGVDPQDVTFHEVGAWDSIADIVCTAVALDWLAPEAIYCSTVPLGQGTVHTAHGPMPIPTPATLLLLEGFPVSQGPPEYERTTPTGAAILAALAQPAPSVLRYTPRAVGVGIGTKDSPAVPNVLRAVLGETDDAAPASEWIECAEANLDDANPEWIGYLMERLFTVGALDVVLIPAQMKKNRPGTLVQVLYPPGLRSTVLHELFAEATTLGVRHYPVQRTILEREPATVATPWGEVTGKVSIYRGQRRFAPEFDTCRAIAHAAGVPLRDVYRAAEAAFAAKTGD